MRNTVYMVYCYENEQTVAMCESIKELKNFLGYKNENTTKSSVSHFLRGNCKYVRDEKNRRYTLARVQVD